MAKRRIKTISVNPDLSAKLDRFPEENWSAVACRAFEIRLKELEDMNDTNEERRAIVRLKVSKMQATDRLYGAGEVAGAQYVLNQAEFSELERLKRWYGGLGTDEGAIMSDLSFHELTAVMANNDGSEMDLEAGMRELYGADVDETHWVQGFFHGALKKYEDLLDKMD